MITQLLTVNLQCEFCIQYRSISRFLWVPWPKLSKLLICKPVIRGLRGLLTFPRNGWGPRAEAAQDVDEEVPSVPTVPTVPCIMNISTVPSVATYRLYRLYRPLFIEIFTWRVEASLWRLGATFTTAFRQIFPKLSFWIDRHFADTWAKNRLKSL